MDHLMDAHGGELVDVIVDDKRETVRLGYFTDFRKFCQLRESQVGRDKRLYPYLSSGGLS